MQPSGLITLLTDFGTEDVYVGVMKGVILQANPAAQIIDLTHQIPPQNIALASFQLQNAYSHFPHGTVHLAVVDPGVGGPRSAIALTIPNGFLVGPNNGIFSGVLADLRQAGSSEICAVCLDNPEFWYTPNSSRTFHGRDIFAAVAARLANDDEFGKLGSPVRLEDLSTLNLQPCQLSETGILGTVQAIDRFGNCISNILNSAVQKRPWSCVFARGQVYPRLATYSEASLGCPLSLVGSHGWVELAVNSGSASQQYGLTLGESIELRWV